MKVSAYNAISIILGSKTSDDVQNDMIQQLKAVIINEEIMKLEARVGDHINRIVGDLKYPQQIDYPPNP